LSYVVNALNNVTGYTYDAFGDQKTVTSYSVKVGPAPTPSHLWSGTAVAAAVANDPKSRTLTFGYDNLGRKISATKPTSSAYASYVPTTGTAIAYAAAANS